MDQMISKPKKKIDAHEKCAGIAQYLDDIYKENMFYAVTVRSTHARAKILSVTVPELPEGYVIVNGDDIPGDPWVRMLRQDWPYFAKDTVNYIGEPLFLIAGPDKEKAKELVYGVKVEYEPLTPYFELNVPTPCPIDYVMDKGNFPAFLKHIPINAYKTLEETFETGYQEHVYLEPQGMMGVYERGKISVYGSIQCPYYVKNALIQAFGWEGEKIQVVQTTTGGAFGGKEEYPSLLAGHVAFAAYKTGHPVKLVFDREEDLIVSTKRHPSRIKIKGYISPGGRVEAMDIDIKLDGGAYTGLSEVVLQRALFAAVSVYNIQHVRVKGEVYTTNTVPTGAFRGFGAPQALFATELFMGHCADELGIDRVEFKKSHFVKQYDSTITSGIFSDPVPLEEMTSQLFEMVAKHDKTGKNNIPDKMRGKGYSFFFHGCGFTGSGERDIIKAQVKLIGEDNRVKICIANVDMGQGTKTAMTKIVEQAFTEEFIQNNNIKIIMEEQDTDLVPDSGPTVASRTIMITGKLVEEAAFELKEKIKEKPGQRVEVIKNYRHPEGKEWDQSVFKGDAYPTYSWGINGVEILVDPNTFEIFIPDFYAVFDAGTAIDETMLDGQIEGGILQGIGYACFENMIHKNGVLQQINLTNYTIPTSMDIPEIHHRLYSSYYERGPFGAKCAGELTFVGAAPAVADAVEQATGLRINKIPITPEYLAQLWNKKTGKE